MVARFLPPIFRYPQQTVITILIFVISTPKHQDITIVNGHCPNTEISSGELIVDDIELVGIEVYLGIGGSASISFDTIMPQKSLPKSGITGNIGAKECYDVSKRFDETRENLLLLLVIFFRFT